MTIEQRLAEMAQGTLVGQRNARYEVLCRLEQAGLISIRYALDGNRRMIWLHNGHAFGRGAVLLAEAQNDNSFPTETTMALVALGLQVHGREIPPPPPPREKSFGAKHVIDWKSR
jgi:hypothetical protein